MRAGTCVPPEPSPQLTLPLVRRPPHRTQQAAADSDGPREGVLIRMPSLNGRELTQPLLTKLQTAREKGIKKGLIYAPRLSWLFGITLLVISVLVAGVTLTTVILGD